MYLNTEYKYSKCIKYNVFIYCPALVVMDVPTLSKIYKNELPVRVYEKHPTLHNSHLLAIAHCILIKI